jgi:hypothetical protein
MCSRRLPPPPETAAGEIRTTTAQGAMIGLNWLQSKFLLYFPLNGVQ